MPLFRTVCGPVQRTYDDGMQDNTTTTVTHGGSLQTSPQFTAALPRSVTSPSRARRLLGPLGYAAGIGGLALALHLHDPHRSGAWGACPSLWIFGVVCPLCGGLRAVHDLTHGDIVAAFWSNAFFVSALPLFALWWLVTLRDRWIGRPRAWNWPLGARGMMPTIIVAAALFTLIRNTPWGARLYL